MYKLKLKFTVHIDHIFKGDEFVISNKFFPLVVNILFALFMGTLMTLAMTLIFAKFIPFPGILSSIALAIIATFIASLIFPAGRIGGEIAKKYNRREGSISYVLLSSILPAIYFTIVVTAVNTISMTGFTQDFWLGFWGTVFIGIVIGYIVSVLSTPIILRIAKKIVQGEK